MGNTSDSDLYPTLTYRDPLLFPQYLSTVNTWSIWYQSRGDWLLNAYINGLDREICDDIEDFADHKQLITDIFDTCRTLGYAVVQFYKNEIVKVFSELQRQDWIREQDPDNPTKVLRVGIKVAWVDDLGNNFADELYFDDRIVSETTEIDYGISKDVVTTSNQNIEGRAYLFIWDQGIGQPMCSSPSVSAFAQADLNLSILSLAIQCRQIQATLTYSATNPFFLHFKYGDSITAAQRTALIAQMSYVNVTNGIGAKEQVLKEIVTVENSSTERSILALDQMIGFFASATRLPLSFYLGEKQTGGLGDTGESTDEVKVSNKKEFILQHFIPTLTEMFSEQFGITLSADLGQFYTKQMEEEKQQTQQYQERAIAVREKKAGINE